MPVHFLKKIAISFQPMPAHLLAEKRPRFPVQTTFWLRLQRADGAPPPPHPPRISQRRTSRAPDR